MWGSYWVNLYPMMVPYPDRPSIDITQAMVEQGISGTQIFRIANEFFISLGMLPVNDGFWENSQFVYPDDGREVGCHPSAWDFGNGVDFRIAMCARITMLDFLIAHHEMGHIQYYMQYKDQPEVFRQGANGAFHEAIGEAIFLSVATPKHLQEIGFLHDVDQSDTKSDINYLFRNALMTIGSLPFSLALSKWRWDLMRGVYHVNDSNDVWWEIKNDLLGVKAPIERSNDDFDPGAMYHFVIDYPYIGYYIRTIIQFQFYQALCRAANHTGPLHTCDFYRSKEAGEKLANMLSMGASMPWPEAMEALTDQREMKADAILEYFQPLMEWLEKTNEKNGEFIGWPSTSATPTGSTRSATSGNTSFLISLLSVVSIIIRVA
ncbi:angiotensin-converting enzyme-like isoform X1 [Lytechinus pictus]|uniref:angiotensin-converting enzyme-like isoform X1 n=1 Tax=Lytechinus pictus TaxID=7653 RepID=UPI0030B9FB11